MEIDLKQLRELMRALKQFELTEIVIEKGDEKIKLRRGDESGGALPMLTAPATSLTVPPPTSVILPAYSSAKASSAEGVFITSPFVGTFYRSPSPNDPPFADVGASVKAGQPLCIIEAMKLMNEIEAEYPCTILEVLAENGKPVEYGDKLFRVKK